MQKNLIIISIVLISLFTTGCVKMLPEAYKIDIQQGNLVKQKNLEKLKLGMTQKQVKFVLGTPLLTDVFNANRWDYIYYLKKGNGKITKSRVVLTFEDGKLSEIDDGHFVAEKKDKAK